MLFYILVFCFIGLALGYFVKDDKIGGGLIAAISLFWFFVAGVWGFAALAELAIGYAIGEQLSKRKRRSGGAKEKSPGMRLTLPGPEPGDGSYTNSIGMKFVKIPAGTFTRTTDYLGNDLEKPQEVTITKPFYLGTYPVTQREWDRVMGKSPSQEPRLPWINTHATVLADAEGGWALWKRNCGFTNPSVFIGEDHPVDAVPWGDAQEFIRRLNELEGHERYRLPTCMEWEIAARGKDNRDNFLVNHWAEDLLDEYSWHSENADDMTHPVGKKKPNSFGLYDIYGNVSEWMSDYVGDVPEGDLVDYKGPAAGENHEARGGRSLSGSEFVRINDLDPLWWNYIRGFRVAFTCE